MPYSQKILNITRRYSMPKLALRTRDEVPLLVVIDLLQALTVVFLLMIISIFVLDFLIVSILVMLQIGFLCVHV